MYFYIDGEQVKEYTTTHTGDWYICVQMHSNTTLQFTRLDGTIPIYSEPEQPVNRYIWSNDAGQAVPTNNRINLISYGELNNNFNFSGKFTIRFTWETNSYSNNSTVYEMINGTDTSGEYGGLTGYRDTSNYGLIFINQLIN